MTYQELQTDIEFVSTPNITTLPSTAAVLPAMTRYLKEEIPLHSASCCIVLKSTTPYPGVTEWHAVWVRLDVWVFVALYFVYLSYFFNTVQCMNNDMLYAELSVCPKRWPGRVTRSAGNCELCITSTSQQLFDIIIRVEVHCSKIM